MNGAGRWFRKPCLLCGLPAVHVLGGGPEMPSTSNASWCNGNELWSIPLDKHALDCIFWTPPPDHFLLHIHAKGRKHPVGIAMWEPLCRPGSNVWRDAGMTPMGGHTGFPITCPDCRNMQGTDDVRDGP